MLNEEVLQCIPEMITAEQNETLQSLPTIEELKKVVLSMSPNSAAGFHMERNGPQINHLSFAENIIIFTFTCKYSLKLIITTLQVYENTSGQLVNKDKSQLLIPANTANEIIDRVGTITGFKCTNGPITYLGCPFYIGRQRINYFTSMIAKVLNGIRGWQTKMLSFGGRVTLVKSVLQSLPIHLLSAITPTTTTMKQIKRLIFAFFWDWEKDKKKYHWAS
ncbi:uncharacterized protein LOC129881999 [Solanum dulcamara]|uniref:uncharacterized protein LOC129881999 n=1 Tax=Solanum dulcamara TaxID=45834 RepID=UPI0024863C4C|nr:uncharacterized protein LOC129881999 [Solanum dulcamara]